MPVILANNKATTLAQDAMPGDTAIVVADGSVLPALGAGEYFYATLYSTTGGALEIVKATARVSNTLTVARGQDGTTAATFYTGALVELRVTAAGVTDAASDAAAALTLSDFGVTATAAELNILDGATATTAELNILDGVTATTAELNILDGVTATTAELNILDGVTATTAELNILDGVTATTAELNIVDGVTATTAELNILDGVTATTEEINTLDGVTGRTGIDTELVTGTAGTTGQFATWTADGDLEGSAAPLPPDASITAAMLAPALLVTEVEGIAANDNDTTVPSSAAAKAYADGASVLQPLGTTTIASGAASYTFAFTPDGYAEIMLSCASLRPTTDNVQLLVRVATDGVTFASTGYDGELQYGGGAARVSTGVLLGTGVGNVDGGWFGQIRLLAPDRVKQPAVTANGTFGYFTGAIYSVNAGGLYLTQQTTNAIQLIFSSGTFAEGVITAYGIRRTI